MLVERSGFADCSTFVFGAGIARYLSETHYLVLVQKVERKSCTNQRISSVLQEAEKIVKHLLCKLLF